MTLRLPVTMLADIIRHVDREHPNEACGVIGGSPNGTLVEVIPMTNADASPDWFRLDPEQQMLVWQDLEYRGLRPVVLYHSHTATPAVPSRTDEAFAADHPDSVFLIVSARDGMARCFRTEGGRLVEEDVDLVV